MDKRSDFIGNTCRKKQQIIDIKYNRKTTTLARLYQEEAIEINLIESKIIFFSDLSISYKGNHTDGII